jgi:hypothetical protein
MRRDSVLKELELLESTIQKQIHLFSQHAEELIEALTEPTEFEHFRKLKELQRVDD